MVKSMTGYGRSEISSDKIHGYIEIKSRNHRHRDIKIYLPRELSSFEIPLKKALHKRILRGKVDLTVQIREYLKKSRSLTLNKNILNEYKRILTDLKMEFGYSGQIDIVNVAQLNDLIEIKEDDEDALDYLPEIEQAVEKAVDALDEMRTFEGKKLLEELNSFMGTISEYADKIEEKRSAMVDEYYDRMKRKILNFVKESSLDEQRLHQEVAYMVDKTDIAEELARLKSHLDQFSHIIKESGPVGKKLDFLFQELNREINTIASKANDFDISAFVIEMKSKLEMAREQVQNIE